MSKKLKLSFAVLLLSGWSMNALSGTDGGYCKPEEIEIDETLEG